MRIGGCSFAFGPKPLESARIIRHMGFQTMDLGVCLGNTQINPFEVSDQPEVVAGRVNRILDRILFILVFDRETAEDYSKTMFFENSTKRSLAAHACSSKLSMKCYYKTGLERLKCSRPARSGRRHSSSGAATG